MTSAASRKGMPRYSAMSWPVNHSPRETMYSGDSDLMTAENSSNFRAIGYLRPSSSAMST